ncbi:hypothetical protein DPMN_107648 [Dreissena polymorpha]|uniref:AB hydrolase-1 domain-containing protein n=2 Tax=Dreissena polymorpha TaxID=45954 RepID=A0A9D4K7C2_DREPO|nr:hypothetical protein DPMN_107648 [Dreissena polymorpha]
MPACLNNPSLGNHDFVHLEDVRLHYVASGQEGKPLMLLLHGFPEFWFSWRYQIPEFKKDYRVVAVDMRGYGDSGKPGKKKDYAIGNLSKDIYQLIQALGYKKCVLVGHDWGGAVAWNFAYSYTDMVEKLVIVNSPHPISFAKYLRTHFSQLKKSWYMMFFQVPFVPEFMFSMNDFAAFEAISKSLRNNPPSDDEVEAYKYAFSQPGALTGPINYYRAAFSKQTKYERAAKLKVPTLVIWGEPDKYLETNLAHEAKNYVENMTVKIIPDSSHFVLLDRPKEVNAAVREFLKDK